MLRERIAAKYAAQNIAELIEVVPSELEQYRPQLHYLLLDEGRFEESEAQGTQCVPYNF